MFRGKEAAAWSRRCNKSRQVNTAPVSSSPPSSPPPRHKHVRRVSQTLADTLAQRGRRGGSNWVWKKIVFCNYFLALWSTWKISPTWTEAISFLLKVSDTLITSRPGRFEMHNPSPTRFLVCVYLIISPNNCMNIIKSVAAMACDGTQKSLNYLESDVFIICYWPAEELTDCRVDTMIEWDGKWNVTEMRGRSRVSSPLCSALVTWFPSLKFSSWLDAPGIKKQVS